MHKAILIYLASRLTRVKLSAVTVCMRKKTHEIFMNQSPDGDSLLQLTVCLLQSHLGLAAIALSFALLFACWPFLEVEVQHTSQQDPEHLGW